MMGLPEGWVTDVPGLSRNAQLKALGNGVVPQQAAMALRLLLDRAGIAPLVAAEGAAVSPLERLEAAANAWYAAPHDSVAEYDAAGEMYDAIQGLLAEVAPGLGEAA